MKHLLPMMIAGLVGCGGAPGDLWISRPGAPTVSLAAQGWCAGGPAIAIRSAARDNPATPLTGLYVTVQQEGTMLASGWTPFTASDLCAGQEYTITAADYGSYRFAAWEDGTATWFRRVVLDASAEYTAVYQVGGSIVPLYSWPLDANGQASSTWRDIAAAHQRWPSIALIPVVNNQNGPGPSRDDAWTSGIGVTLPRAPSHDGDAAPARGSGSAPGSAHPASPGRADDDEDLGPPANGGPAGAVNLLPAAAPPEAGAMDSGVAPEPRALSPCCPSAHSR